MEAFHWDSCFVIGQAMVDEQHHHLVDVINAFGAQVVQPDGVSAQDAQALFDELMRYTQYHFTEEEALMTRAGLGAQHQGRHKQEHAQFLQDVQRLHADWARDPGSTGRALVDFLSNWLAFHILGTDQLMAWLLRARAAGTSEQEALESWTRTRDPATATLLQAMHRLFEQVSERNRALFDLNQTLEARVAERTAALSAANAQLEAMALTDVLTSLPNRRAAMLALQRAWADSVQAGDALACMMIDADGFKQINDQFGHDAGDEVLRVLARTLREALRTDDRVFRLGGDEFLVVAEHTTLSGALILAEKVRKTVADLRVSAGAGVWVGSVSIGVGAREPRHTDVESLLKTADQGVYAAKAAGRNAVASVQ